MTILVCATNSNFLNDVQAVCNRCGGTVYHRPHAPEGIERVCLSCYLKTMGPDDEWGMTVRTWEELRAYFAADTGRRH